MFQENSDSRILLEHTVIIYLNEINSDRADYIFCSPFLMLDGLDVFNFVLIKGFFFGPSPFCVVFSAFRFLIFKKHVWFLAIVQNILVGPIPIPYSKCNNNLEYLSRPSGARLYSEFDISSLIRPETFDAKIILAKTSTWRNISDVWTDMTPLTE